MDLFTMDCGAFSNDSPQKQSEKSEDDDYMELFVAKELKDKITPIEDTLNAYKTQLESL